MPIETDLQLYQLYMEMGEVHTRRERLHEAADSYALALYYAKRMGDAVRVGRCRELVLARSPNHVAGQVISAPLFFAQLLMRYPADEVEQALAAAEAEGGAVATATLEPPVASETQNTPFRMEVGPAFIATGRPPMPAASSYDSETDRRLLQTSAAPELPSEPPAAAPAGFPAFENHHIFDLGMSGSAQRMQSLRASEDFLLKDAGLSDAPGEEDAPSLFGNLVNFLAILTVLFGVGVAGYFGYELYPILYKIHVDRLVGTFLQEDASSGGSGTESAEQDAHSAPAPALAKAAANQPASLRRGPAMPPVEAFATAEGDAEHTPPPPLQIGARTGPHSAPK